MAIASSDHWVSIIDWVPGLSGQEQILTTGAIFHP
jgi:hypothetical protein